MEQKEMYVWWLVHTQTFLIRWTGIYGFKVYKNR